MRPELIPSVSRSAGLDKDGEQLKNKRVQEEYRAFIEEKLKALQKLRNKTKETPQETKRREEVQANLLILFRKLREGIFSASRKDSFAYEVYETSLYLSIIFTAPKQTSSIVPHLLLLTTDAPSSHDAPLITLLNALVTHFPSQRPYNELLRGKGIYMSPDATRWLCSISSALRHNAYANIPNLVSRAPSLLSPKANPFAAETLGFLLSTISAKAREQSWDVLRKSYVEWSCQEGSETRIWLAKSLQLATENSDLDTYLSGKTKAGQVKLKDGTPGRYVVCRGG